MIDKDSIMLLAQHHLLQAIQQVLVQHGKPAEAADEVTAMIVDMVVSAIAYDAICVEA